MLQSAVFDCMFKTSTHEFLSNYVKLSAFSSSCVPVGQAAALTSVQINGENNKGQVLKVEKDNIFIGGRK